MAQCAYCKAETQLHDGGVPVCIPYSEKKCKPPVTGEDNKCEPPATGQQIRGTLLQDVFELTARTNEATREFEAVMGQIPSGLPYPDGTQQIKDVSSRLSTARKPGGRISMNDRVLALEEFG